MSAIGRELGVSTDKVRWWINKYNISIRSKSEQSYLQHDPNGDKHLIKENLTVEDSFLFGLGLGIYWGEGNKVDEYSVRVGNTDPRLLKSFIRFLIEICGVKKENIKLGLQIFNDIDEKVALAYWMTKLDFPITSFHKKISVIPPQGKGTYKRKSKYGVLQIYVSNKRLKQWIMQKIEDIK
jgi:hypothetical protein